MSDDGRKLNAFDATLLVMGGIIGVGIFFTPQLAAEKAGEPWAFLTLWVIGGLIAMSAAFTFAELGATFPNTGGWFVYLRHAFGRAPAFLFAWVVLAVVTTGAAAGVAKFCVTQLRVALPAVFGELDERVVAIAILSVITIVGLCGVKRAALVQNLCMLVKLLAILALIVCGFVFLTDGSDAPAAVATAAGGERSVLKGMLSALLPVFFAYGGWQMVGYIAPEVREPERTIPRAIVLGVLGVMLVYVLANVSFLAVLGIDGMASDKGFAARIARESIGPGGERILAGCMAVSALGWCIVAIITAPWLYVAMARERVFFQAFGTLSAKRGVPTLALLLQGGISIAYVFASIDFIVNAVVAVEWIFHGMVALALIKLRRTRPDLPRPYASPFFPLAPVVYALAAVAVVVSTVVTQEVEVQLTAVAVVVVGAVVYAVWSAATGGVRETDGPSVG